MANLLVYGSYGYTGRLVAEKAVAEGLDPILAGRDAEAVLDQADDLDCRSRVFTTEHAKTVADFLEDVDVVLNCAGPFAHTADTMIDGCLDVGTHYLDVTGEWRVFDAIQQRGEAARDAGVMLLPGVGFDVVPSDCLAAHLHDRLPSANHLRLALSTPGGMSRGTALTMVENLGKGGVIREDGVLVDVPLAAREREVAFSHGDRTVMSIPWGDVVTAHRSTGIPNIEVYAETNPKTVSRLRKLRKLSPVLGSSPVQAILKKYVNWRISGPDEETLEAGRGELWGEVSDGVRRKVSRLHTPNPYALTRDTAVLTAKKAQRGDVTPGFQTPSTAYGTDLVLELDGVERVDVGGV
ncbi:saccharopine dehydrogenase family protein [Haloarchaeobius sp. TZWWS8]|uniref:saccharopine dehydrogenase family protein n=1 Tax=Haloarchaeobius sp. TZWWS8 TaxID=3446121 RepID=UPI003EBD0B12